MGSPCPDIPLCNATKHTIVINPKTDFTNSDCRYEGFLSSDH